MLPMQFTSEAWEQVVDCHHHIAVGLDMTETKKRDHGPGDGQEQGKPLLHLFCDCK